MKSKHDYIFFLLSMFFALTLGSCSKDDPTSPIPIPPPPSTAGYWFGDLTEGSLTGVIALSVTQDLVRIGGTGTLAMGGFTISGENHYPKVTMTFSSPGYYPFTFDGQFTSPTELSGLVSGSGFYNASVTLVKK